MVERCSMEQDFNEELSIKGGGCNKSGGRLLGIFKSTLRGISYEDIF